MKIKIVFILLIVLALTACGPAVITTPMVKASSTETLFSSAETPRSTATIPPYPSPTLFPLPTIPLLSTLVPSETASPTQTPLPEVLPKFPLDGYVILYNKDGDLYYQDGNNAPVNLVHVGETTYNPFKLYNLSDDNKILALGAGIAVNTDGTQEKLILPAGWRDSLLWGTKIGNIDFVPGTHKLVFRTYLCDSFDNPTSCTSSLYLTDIDTGDIKKLADLGFSGGYLNETFKLSPDGQMVAISTTSSVSIINLEGEVVRRNILPYAPSTPSAIFPLLFWYPDSTGLIIGIPNTLFDSIAYNYVPAYTIWHYEIEGNIAIQIPLNPAPMAFCGSCGEIQVSPDGQWIIYGGLSYNPEVYLGNLLSGQLQIIGKGYQTRYSWAPDSKHFMSTSAGSALGGVESPTLIPIGNVGEWIDGNHFVWFTVQDNSTNLCVAEIVPGGLKIYDLGFDEDAKILLIRPK